MTAKNVGRAFRALPCTAMHFREPPGTSVNRHGQFSDLRRPWRSSAFPWPSPSHPREHVVQAGSWIVKAVKLNPGMTVYRLSKRVLAGYAMSFRQRNLNSP